MTTRNFKKALLVVAFAVSAATSGCATTVAPVSTSSALTRPSIAERRQCVAAANEHCYATFQDARTVDECLADRISACESGRAHLVASAQN